MPSREAAWLVRKEWRELLASRAYWLLLLMIGPLAGHAFITAVDAYAEASGIGGGPAALAQGLSPLDGILVPTFGAYDIAVTLLFPFVAIRLVSGEKESGALKLMLQGPPGQATQLFIKGMILIAGWMVAWTPAFLALCLWTSYGGSLYAPELLNLLLGHLLRVMLAAGIAIAAASIANSAATAAIATLGFTVGTWALDFIAAGRGGWLQTLGAFTPAAALRSFEQGLFTTSIVAVSLVLTAGGFVVAGIWLPPRRGWLERAGLSLAALAAIAVAVTGAAALRTTSDLSENRRNSFSAAEETALRRIRSPLRVAVNLAPEDPRLSDLERNVLNKLRRILPRVDIEYVARTRTGLFEAPGDHYGEIWYQIDGRRVMSRSTTEPIVLETILTLAHVPPPAEDSAPGYSGHPLAAHPFGAAWLFYGAWPLLVGLVWLFYYRSGS